MCYQPGLATSFKNATTAGLVSASVGAKLIAKQSKHVPRRTKSGNPLYTAPGNLFPAPVVADTSKQELVCIPTDVLGVTVAP